MSRSDDFIKILDAGAKIHEHIAVILEAKAIEAEISTGWTKQLIQTADLNGHQEQLKLSEDFHAQFIEIIEGITKMEGALAQNMKVVLGKNEHSAAETGGLLNLGEVNSELFS